MTRAVRRYGAVWRSFREAVAAMVAILAAFAAVLVINPEPGSLILSVVLTLSLSRSQLDRDRRGRLEAALLLPVIGLVSLGVGTLRHTMPVAGALLFVTGVAGSIWLRRFGPAAYRAGALIALPFVVLLVTPYVPTHRLGPALTILMPVLVAVIALAAVTLVHVTSQWLGWLPAAPREAGSPIAAATAERRSLRPIASTRMAIQMAVALAAAFAVGFVLFQAHWSWIVLTAFIVNSGNRGRGDVAHKSVLRVLGAGAGTLAALLLTAPLDIGTVGAVAAILLAVFFGLWLRPLGYAWWALFVTLALAMLQTLLGRSLNGVLWPRLEAIGIGAVIGVGAAWFVLPVRSIDVLRSRIAHALAALSAALDPAMPSSGARDFLVAVERVGQLAPAFRALRCCSRKFVGLQPADWIDALESLALPVSIAIDNGRPVPGLRAEIGRARRAVREPREILPALQALQRILL